MDFTEAWPDTCSKVGYAARIGNVELMRHLIEQNVSVDVADNRGWRPLHEAAAISSNLECLELLLKHDNTDINWVTHEGETALLLACKRRKGKDAEIAATLLLEHGADPNILDNEEESPLLTATRSKNISLVKKLLNSKNVNTPDCSRWYPLHEAALLDDIELLTCFINANACLDVQDECGLTPLFTAAQHGRENSLKYLLAVLKERGQEHVIDKGAEDWATPLMIASQQGFVNCVKMLLDNGANPHLLTSDRATALHMAVQGDHYECLELLLGKMNIHTLIAVFKPSSCSIPFDTISPLHLAIKYQSHRCLQLLLQAGFSPDSLYEPSRFHADVLPAIPLAPCESALSYAIHKKNYTAIQFLLNAGANLTLSCTKTFHPLIRAFCCPVLDYNLIHILLERSPDINKYRGISSNELLIASFGTNIEVVKMLLYFGCDINLSFQNEQTSNLFKIGVHKFLLKNFAIQNEFLRLLLRFIIVNKHVQYTFHNLSIMQNLDTLEKTSFQDILKEIDQISTLKKICIIKIRQHLYNIHGVFFANVTHHLCLPDCLEYEIACHDLKNF